MIEDSYTWNDAILGLFRLTKESEDSPDYALVIKLQEELGEFSEIMLHEMGYLRHKDKKWKDTPIEEAADIINVLIGALSKHYPSKTSEELAHELFDAMKKKGAKYAKLLGEKHNISTR